MLIIYGAKLIEKYLVIIDTNIIFNDDKKIVVNPSFDEFFNENTNKSELIIHVPEVVEGEILYQQTKSALKTLERIDGSFDNLSSVTNKRYSHRIKKEKVKSDVKERFHAWAKDKKVNFIETPVDIICWENAIRDAIWRNPPFIEGEKNTEKGFRDFLILETVVSFANKNINKNIVFLCNDGLLKETAENRLKENSKFYSYSSLNEFSSSIRLRSEELEEKFVNSITKKAREKFFTKNDRKTFVYKEKINFQIKSQFKNELESPEDLLPEALEDSNLISDIQINPIDKGIFFVSELEFIKREEKKTFFWQSSVKYRRSYKTIDHDDFYSSIFHYEVNFHINWKVNISQAKRFDKMELINIKLSDRQLTADEL